jgi:hypothetical protein
VKLEAATCSAVAEGAVSQASICAFDVTRTRLGDRGIGETERGSRALTVTSSLNNARLNRSQPPPEYRGERNGARARAANLDGLFLHQRAKKNDRGVGRRADAARSS